MYEYVSPLSPRFASKKYVCIVLLYSIRVRTNFSVISGTHHTPPKCVRVAVEVRLSVRTHRILLSFTFVSVYIFFHVVLFLFPLFIMSKYFFVCNVLSWPSVKVPGLQVDLLYCNGAKVLENPRKKTAEALSPFFINRKRRQSRLRPKNRPVEPIYSAVFHISVTQRREHLIKYLCILPCA
jgi:hypothetical protein